MLLLVDTMKIKLLLSEALILQQQQEINDGEKTARRRKRRSVWVKPWLLRRPIYGQYEKLMAELVGEDVNSFKNFMRMDPDTFHEILTRIGPRIEKQDTFWRRALNETKHLGAQSLRGSVATERGRMWEGGRGCLPPTVGNFFIFRLEIGQSGAYLRRKFRLDDIYYMGKRVTIRPTG